MLCSSDVLHRPMGYHNIACVRWHRKWAWSGSVFFIVLILYDQRATLCISREPLTNDQHQDGKRKRVGWLHVGFEQLGDAI